MSFEPRGNRQTVRHQHQSAPLVRAAWALEAAPYNQWIKRLGLSLGQIGELLIGEDALDPILAFQERVLAKDGERIARALNLLRTARTKLASGATLSIDDLAALTQETVMTKHPTPKELNEVMTPFNEKHLAPEDRASLKEWGSGHPDVAHRGKALMEEASALMASGDATSAAAMDLARRIRALGEQVKSDSSPVAALQAKIKAALDDARSDPEVSQKLGLFGFIQKAVANLKAQESDAEGAA